MVDISRVRATWTGFPGAPGVSTFYFASVTDADLNGIAGFFNNLASRLPGDVHIQVAGDGDTLDEATGTLTGSWTGTAPGPTVGADGGGYSAPSGATVRWLTTFIHGGHRVNGRTFIVPFSGGSFATDGTLIPAAITQLQGAAAAFLAVAPANFQVWSRPRDATPAWTDVHGVTHAARAGVAGQAFSDSAFSVPEQAVLLPPRADRPCGGNLPPGAGVRGTPKASNRTASAASALRNVVGGGEKAARTQRANSRWSSIASAETGNGIMRTIADVTFGGGSNASGRTSNSDSMS